MSAVRHSDWWNQKASLLALNECGQMNSRVSNAKPSLNRTLVYYKLDAVAEPKKALAACSQEVVASKPDGVKPFSFFFLFLG